MSNLEIKIGTCFIKRLSKGKVCKCQVVDIIERYSTNQKKIISEEYWATCISGNFNLVKTFEVAKSTIIIGYIN